MKLGLAALAALALGAAAPSCSSSKDTLVVVAVTSGAEVDGVTSLLIEVDSVQKTFMPATLSTIPQSFGVYVSGDLTGSKLVVATARTAGSCYLATGHVTLPGTNNRADVALTLAASKDCKATGGGGSTGSGGTTAAGGSTGSGGATGGTTGSGGTTENGGSGGTSPTGGTTGSGGTTASGGITGAGGTTSVGGTTGAGGTTATGGVTGTGGLTGAGGGTVVTPPSLTKCTEYRTVTATCDFTDITTDPAIWSLAFSPDGKLLLTADEVGHISFWNVGTDGKLTANSRVLTSDGQAYLAFSPDGTMLVGGSNNGMLTVWSTSTWTILRSYDGLTGTIYGVGFSPDSKQIIALDDNGDMTVHNVGSSTAARSFTLPTAGYTLGVSPVQTATDYWIGAGYSDGDGDFINLAMSPASGLPISIDSTDAEAIAFSRDGSLAVTGGGDGIVQFWKIPPAATPVATAPTLTFNAQTINALAFSPDNKNLGISVGVYGSLGRIGIWDPATRQPRGAFAPTYTPLSFAWHPGGAIIAAGEYDCGMFVVCTDK
ncbi:MAG TPA: hypothetical protein VHJ20_23730 [Polyangia bacterium]|nr:hypothetical protein [Polyangia bacterium]